MLFANAVLVSPCSEMILFSLCTSVTVISSVFRSVHQRDIDEEFLAGFDIEFFVNVGIVILQRAFLDIRRFQNFLCGQPRNIVVENFTFGFREIRNSFQEEAVCLRINRAFCMFCQLINLRLCTIVCFFCRVSLLNQRSEVVGTFLFFVRKKVQNIVDLYNVCALTLTALGLDLFQTFQDRCQITVADINAA